MKNIIFIIIISFFISCKNKEQVRIDTSKIKPSKVFKTFGNKNNYFYAFATQNTNSLLIRLKLRGIDEGVSIFNIYSKNRKDIKLDQTQLRELKRIRGFYYKNKDSIFFIGLTKILIVNNQGKTIYSNFFNSPTDNNYFPISCSNTSPPFIFKRKIFFNKLIDGFPDNNYYRQNTLLSFDLNKDKLKLHNNTSYPLSLFNKCWFLNELNVFNAYDNKDLLVYSFPVNDSLFIYSLSKDKIIKKIYAKTQYKRNKTTPANCNEIWNYSAYYKYVYNNFLFRNIIFDKYRDIFYRLVFQPKPNYDLKKKFNSLDIPFSIQVFDHNFKMLGESEVLNLKPTYIYFDYFVTKEGLWLSTNNPKNPAYNEDELHFELFSINK